LNTHKKAGYWSIATQKHLKEFKTTTANLDELDNLNTAGKAGRFLGIIRGNGEIKNITKLEKMAQGVGISKKELHRIILPEIESASDQKVELIKDKSGQIEGIVEYVFNNDEVLEIAGNVFFNQPSIKEELMQLIQWMKQRGFPILKPS